MPRAKRAKRQYRPLSDSMIVYLFRLGLYRVDGTTIRNRKGQALKVYDDSHYHANPYLSVELHYRGARKKIMLHKLLWMIHHGRTVPEGCQLHHLGDKSEVHPERIQLLTAEDHERLHQKALDDFLSR